jgi:hypothetical protein
MMAGTEEPMRRVTGALISCLVLAPAACRPASESPLVQAAVQGRADEVARLLAGGASPDERSSRGFSVLGFAARAGSVAVIEQLVRAGADPDVRDTNENQWTPLLHAASEHRRDAALALLRSGANPNLGSGLTPLIMAAGNGDTEMVRALLDSGADPHVRVKSGENALGAAVGGPANIGERIAGRCRTETVKLLLERAPDLRLEMIWIARPLTWPARLGNCTEIMSLVEGRRGGRPPANPGSSKDRR